MDIVHGHCPGDNDLYFGYNEVIKTLILVIMNSANGWQVANGWQGGHCPCGHCPWTLSGIYSVQLLKIDERIYVGRDESSAFSFSK